MGCLERSDINKIVAALPVGDGVFPQMTVSLALINRGCSDDDVVKFLPYARIAWDSKIRQHKMAEYARAIFDYIETGHV